MPASGSESNSKIYCVGIKQTKLAIEKGEAIRVIIAGDADKKLVDPIAELCRELEIPLVGIVSMRELGKVCGIQVGAAAAAVVRK